MAPATKKEQAIVGCLNLWDRLELVFEENGREGRYRTRVEDVHNGGLVINRPSLLNGDALFTVGARFVAWFIKSDSAYTFSGRILQKIDGEIDQYLITMPTAVERNQRRRYYRIADDSPVSVIIADHIIRARDPEAEVKVFEGIAVNISGSGICLRSKMLAEAGTKVLLTPRFKGLKREFSLIGIIRRKETRDDNWHEYGIEIFTIEEIHHLFSSLPLHLLPKRYLMFNENERSHLLNYIFNKQLELKKKGLI